MKAASSTKNRSVKAATIDDDDDVVSSVEEVAAEEGTISDSGRDTSHLKMVRFALTSDISPAPVVGEINMTRDYGVTDLKKGIVTIPKGVADVLHDKGYGEIVR